MNDSTPYDDLTPSFINSFAKNSVIMVRIMVLPSGKKCNQLSPVETESSLALTKT